MYVPNILTFEDEDTLILRLEMLPACSLHYRQ